MILITRRLTEPMTVLVLIAGIAGSYFGSGVGAFGQTPRKPDLNLQPTYKPPPTVKSRMTAAERFDDIPEYTGKSKFVQGTKYDKERAIMYMEIFHVQESRTQVIDWYKNSLSARGWQVNASNATVSGYRKGSQNTVNVTVNEIPLGDGARCELVVQAFRMK